MADLFVANAILLFHDGQGDKSGSEKVTFGVMEGVQGPSPDPQMDVLEAELGTRVVGRRSSQIFARPHSAAA